MVIYIWFKALTARLGTLRGTCLPTMLAPRFGPRTLRESVALRQILLLLFRGYATPSNNVKLV
ncbi:hypothetical protein DPMN_024340 [Dreissena polymorpha]|uniref:Uncharacterized protein n=1 Tax=Dreissena polymorpha TaxID=45954 RepID=A0A9D4LME4_DREPO|nr:hypothetical protein DPMN_024340 [Dreissena polymorpha]